MVTNPNTGEKEAQVINGRQTWEQQAAVEKTKDRGQFEKTGLSRKATGEERAQQLREALTTETNVEAKYINKKGQLVS